MRLPPPNVPPLVRAPVRAVQFVVELVGPRTVPAAQAAELLRPDWRAALGHPELWAMRPADTRWMPLMAAQHGSYDSIALAWDFASPAGEISPASATHLVGTAEKIANALGRRAIPLTAPNDLPREIRRLRSAQNDLDAGLTILVIAPRPFPTADLGRSFEAMGLSEEAGEFVWKAEGHPEPLFAVTPFDDGPSTDGFSLGFRLGRCPDPNQAMGGLFEVVDALVAQGLHAFDEDRKPLTPAVRQSIRQQVQAAATMLESAGLKPGSWAALKTFV